LLDSDRKNKERILTPWPPVSNPALFFKQISAGAFPFIQRFLVGAAGESRHIVAQP